KGHGGIYSDLAAVNRRDWEKQVSEEICLLSGEYEKLFVIGHSTGAMLAVRCTTGSTAAAGVVSISTPVFIVDKALYDWGLDRRIRDLSRIFPYIRTNSGSFFYHYQGRKISRSLYARMSVSGINQIMLLSKETLKGISSFDRPILMIHARDDKTADFRGTELMFEQIGASGKEKFLTEKGNHMLILNDGRDAVFEKIAEFISRVK
ncbi:MAG: alpha/beta hydrolase, partial [Candidatus Wallbacteria bacterium]|nr:alpha/beta hydrolase [Candidatus Wallbacteria bacterium]